MSPARRRRAVDHVCWTLGISKRRTCRVLRQPRSTQRYEPRLGAEEPLLVKRIVELASEYGRYGYRRIRALLREEGWRVNHKRVERIWRQEGLKVPKKQPKRRRLWLCDGSCVRHRPEYRNHVWAYDFVHESDNGSEFTATAVRRWLKRVDVKTLFIEPGSPWENGYVESFIGKLRDELLNREIFCSLWEAKVLLER